MSRRAFMTDPRQLASLEGQQYLVLRPTAEVAEIFEAAQAEVLAELDVPAPRTAHVTLRGFFEPERVDALRTALTAWAQRQPPIEVRAEAIDGFPAPFQILIARLARTPSLVGAYADLTSMLGATDLRRIGELPLDEWIFHLSMAYGRDLSAAAWEAAYGRYARALADLPSETLHEVEFVWYVDGVEHADVLPFGG